MRKSLACLLAVFLLTGLWPTAFAGVLYNGFETYDIGLKSTNSRFAVRLTGDTTVWVKQGLAATRGNFGP